MRRRTRLRKQGLPADPPKARTRTEKSLFDTAKEMAAQGLPPSWYTDWRMVESCHRNGIDMVKLWLSIHGTTPEGWRPQ